MHNDLRDKIDQIEIELIDLKARGQKYEQFCNAFGIWSPSVALSGGVGVELELGVQLDAEALCKVFRKVNPEMEAAKAKSLVVAKRAEIDPPSDDYLTVVQPRTERLDVPEGASAPERRAYNAVQAQRRVAAYIDAHVDAFERYQGAESADNGNAMRRQVRAMSRFADSAKTSGRDAARSWHDFDRAMFAALERWSRAQGLTGKKDRRAALSDQKTKAMEALEKARASGQISASDAASARRGIEFMLGEGWPAFLDEWRLRLKRGPQTVESQFSERLLQLSRGLEELTSLRLELPKQAGGRQK